MSWAFLMEFFKISCGVIALLYLNLITAFSANATETKQAGPFTVPVAQVMTVDRPTMSP